MNTATSNCVLEIKEDLSRDTDIRSVETLSNVSFGLWNDVTQNVAALAITLTFSVSSVSASTNIITDFDRLNKQLQIDRFASAREATSTPIPQFALQAVPAPKSIWEIIQDEFSHVSDEELSAWPTDGAAQIDHYLYGMPKR